MPCWTSLNLVAPIESVSYTSATDNQLSLLFRRRARGPYLFFVRPLYLDCLVDEQDSIEHNTTPHTLYRIKRREKIREKERESILPIHVGCLLLCPTSSDKKKNRKERESRFNSALLPRQHSKAIGFCYFYRLVSTICQLFWPIEHMYSQQETVGFCIRSNAQVGMISNMKRDAGFSEI